MVLVTIFCCANHTYFALCLETNDVLLKQQKISKIDTQDAKDDATTNLTTMKTNLDNQL